MNDTKYLAAMTSNKAAVHATLDEEKTLCGREVFVLMLGGSEVFDLKAPRVRCKRCEAAYTKAHSFPRHLLF